MKLNILLWIVVGCSLYLAACAGGIVADNIDIPIDRSSGIGSVDVTKHSNNGA